MTGELALMVLLTRLDTRDAAALGEESVAQIVVPDAGSSGSGFIVDEDLLITNAHVLGSGDEVFARFADGEEVSCSIEDVDSSQDLAALTCDTGDRQVLDLAEDRPELGEEVVALGYPGGALAGEETLALTSGVVSRPTAEGGYIQTEAALNPGNSGGPLIALDGLEVVGVATAVDDSRENTGFAIPAPAVRDFLDGASSSEPPTTEADDDGDGEGDQPSVEPADPPRVDDDGLDLLAPLLALLIGIVAGWFARSRWKRSPQPAPRILIDPNRAPRPEQRAPTVAVEEIDPIEVALVGQARPAEPDESEASQDPQPGGS